MTGNFFGENGQPKDLDPFTEQRVGERLRAALADHAGQFEPAPNSYLTLSKRLEEAVPDAPKSPGRGNGRIFAAAAIFLLVVGAGAFAITQNRTGDVNAVGSDGPSETVPNPLPTTTTVPAEEPSTTVATVATTTTPPPEVGAAVVDRVSLPPAANSTEAAADFVHLLGLPGNGRFAPGGNIVEVLPPDNLGSDQPRAVIRTVASDSGTSVVDASSDTMVIDDVFVDGDQIVVRGEGIAFEASVEVKLIGTDGTPLAFASTTAGCCEELVRYEARLPMVSGSGEAFVVAYGEDFGGGEIPAFAAKPITFNGPPLTTNYSVFRIRPDDSDQGLNVRDLPGTDEGKVLATLPPGQTGIRRLPTMPALVGDSFWWEVETEAGLQGWVHSSFLVADSSFLTDADLVEQARFAVSGINTAEFDGLSSVPLSRRVPVALGWIGDPRATWGPETDDIALWTQATEWRVPEATYGEPAKLISLRSLLNLPDDLEVEPEIQLGAATIYGFEEEFVNSYFAGTRAVTVIGSDSGDQPARSTMLFYEATPVGPQLVGVVVSIFVP